VLRQGLHGPDVVVALVERRADQVVHPGVDDHELLLATLLAIQNARQQDARVAGDVAAGLKGDLVRLPLQQRHERLGVLGHRQGLIGPLIVHAEPAADVEPLDLVAALGQPVDQGDYLGHRIDVRLHIVDR